MDEETFVFGSFRLTPAQRVLLEDVHTRPATGEEPAGAISIGRLADARALVFLSRGARDCVRDDRRIPLCA
jgi:hypothetical protein